MQKRTLVATLAIALMLAFAAAPVAASGPMGSSPTVKPPVAPVPKPPKGPKAIKIPALNFGQMGGLFHGGKGPRYPISQGATAIMGFGFIGTAPGQWRIR